MEIGPPLTARLRDSIRFDSFLGYSEAVFLHGKVCLLSAWKLTIL